MNPISGKSYLDRYQHDRKESDLDKARILKKLERIFGDKNKMKTTVQVNEEPSEPNRWDEMHDKPLLDYSEFFDNDAGQCPGVTIWVIEDLVPNKIEEEAHGQFHKGDCYLILKTSVATGSLAWQIHFWIGDKATVDKRTCAAMHAVHLRNFLCAECRTIREEQGYESDEFLSFFGSDIAYLEGDRASSWLFAIEM
jgi:hypothetical protein